MRRHLQSEETRRKISESCKRRGVGKWMVGRKASPETIKRMSIANKGMGLGIKRLDLQGENNVWWKGDNVSYRGLHQWLIRKLGKAKHCSLDRSHYSTRYHWANISGEYKRNVKDWIQLCPRCHSAYDNKKISLFEFFERKVVT